MKFCLPSLVLPALLSQTTTAIAQKIEKQPNIVIVFIDDLGYNDLGFRNPSFQTKNIDQFAAENINYECAYVPSPTSSPSRAGLLTGKHPIRAGLVRHINEQEKDPKGSKELGLLATDPGRKYNRKALTLDQRTFADALKEEGYTTYHVGKWHLGKSDYYPDKHGFDYMFGESDLGLPVSYFPPYFRKANFDLDGTYLTDSLTNSAVSVIQRHDYEKSPLLLYFAHYAVHSPHMCKKEMLDKYLVRGLDKKYAIYHAMVESMDESFGRVIGALKEKGIYDNTVVIFTSDQGGYFTNAPLKGGKLDWPLHEGGARVPLFIHYPYAEGQRSVTERVSTMDIYPTLVELATNKPCKEKGLDGISLCKSLRGRDVKERPLFFYRSYENQYASVISDNIKYIITRDGNDIMYDLIKDPQEEVNLFNNKNYLSKQKKVKKLLDEFLEKYDSDMYYVPNVNQ